MSRPKEYTHCAMCGGRFHKPVRSQVCEECMDREDEFAVERIRAFVRRLREGVGRPTG